MQSLLAKDLALFRLINNQWHNDFFDAVLPWIRVAEFWYPVYFFLILFVLINFKQTGWRWILLAALTAILTNFISSDLIKENVHRLRPCNNPALADWARVLVLYRPQSSSFTSSHAANHFGLATFLFITLRNVMGKWALLFFVWAASICYAQLYVGVHYPLDILGGTLVGLLVGVITGTLFEKRFGLR
jgi:membrane-associated phospholipid phosphatase